MKIKQDPVTKLWCKEDGAVLMPPTSKHKGSVSEKALMGSGAGTLVFAHRQRFEPVLPLA